MRLGKFYNTEINKSLLKAWENNNDKQNEAKREFKIGIFLILQNFLAVKRRNASYFEVMK
jgi:hypothetical protein